MIIVKIEKKRKYTEMAAANSTEDSCERVFKKALIQEHLEVVNVHQT